MADLDWIFQIEGNAKQSLEQVDQVLASLPKDLAKAEAGLKSLERAAAANAIAKINDPLRQNIALAKLHAATLREEAESQKKASAGSDELASSLANAFGVGQVAKISGVAGAIDLVGGAIKSTAHFLVGGAIELFKFGIEAQQGKRAMIGMLDVFEGSRSEKVFDVIQEMGLAIGASADKAVEAYGELRQAGFAAKGAQDVLAASFDIAAARGGGERGDAAASKFRELFTKFEQGKQSAKDILALAGSVGINREQIGQALAKNLGTTADSALAQLEAGRVDTRRIQNSLLDIVEKDINKGGGLGTKAKELADSSLPAQLQRIKDTASNLFENAHFEPVIKLTKSFADALAKAGADGGPLKTLVEETVDLLGGIGEVDFETAIQEVANALFVALGAAKEFGAGVSEGFDTTAINEALAQLDAIDQVLGTTSSKGEGIRTIGKAFGTVATSIAITIAYLTKFISLAWQATKAITPLDAVFGKAGKDASDGMAGGIKAGTPKVDAAAKDLAAAPVARVEKDLEIHSPSRVLERRGENTGEGMALGIERSTGRVEAAMASAVSVPSGSAGGAQLSGRGSSSRGGVVVNIGTLVVQGGGSGNVREEARVGILEAFEELGFA